MKTFTIKTAWNRFNGLLETNFGWTREDLEADYEIYNDRLPVKDYFWGLLNKMIVDNPKSGKSAVYFDMARFVHDYEGKSGLQYCRLSLQERLPDESPGSNSIQFEVEIIPDPECNYAKELSKNKYPFASTIDDIPLANHNCERKVCRCDFALAAKRDENGRLIINL